MRRVLRGIGWGLVAVLALLPWYFPPRGSSLWSPSLAVRLLGPLARPAAAWQWVRVDAAIRAGRTDIALARAEIAFALDPSETRGWLPLAGHLAFERASPEREPDPARRIAWLLAGLAVARRGEASCAEPLELVEWQIMVLDRTATVDPDLPWPGGLAGLFNEIAALFDRAAGLGAPDAAENARLARSIADGLARQ